MIKPSENKFPNARILVVDDNPENVKLVSRFLEWAGYLDVELVTDSTSVLALIEQAQPDIVLLDLHMPKVSGYDILAAMRQEESPLRLIPVLVFTADNTTEARARALESGASDFLTKPGDAQEILVRVRNFLEVRRMHLRVERYNAELEERVQIRTGELHQARREALESLALAAEFRDDETGAHTKRVGEMSSYIARRMGCADEYVESIRLAAPLHDVGKVGISDAILLKPGGYDEEEFAMMKMHTIMGANILAAGESPLMQLAREIALSHHERWDGTGYPHKLVGQDIPLSARIVAVADVYDALVSERPYKPAWSHEKAVEEIVSLSGTQFDPQVVIAFQSIMREMERQLAA